MFWQCFVGTGMRCLPANAARPVTVGAISDRPPDGLVVTDSTSARRFLGACVPLRNAERLTDEASSIWPEATRHHADPMWAEASRSDDRVGVV